MSRSLSSSFLEALYSERTNEVFLVLLSIAHADLVETIRVVNNTENITSSGVEYTAFPFTLSLPDDIEDQLPAVTLSIDNVDRSIVEAVRTINSPATVSLSVVLASDPDTVEIGPITLTMRQVEYDQLTVSGTLQPADLLSEPFPQGRFSPNRYPGLF